MHVWVSGQSETGALGLGKSKLSVQTPEKLPSTSNIASVSCGVDTLALISLDGTLSVSGFLPNGEQSFEPSSYSWEFTGKVVSVSFGRTFCILVTEDKWTEVWSWGLGTTGQLGLGSNIEHAPVPTTIDALGGLQISSVSVSETNVLALTSESEIYVWGSNTAKATGTGSSEPFVSTPTQYKGLEGKDVLSIACGNEFFYAFVGCGEFYCWGKNGDGMLGKTFFAELVPCLKSIDALDIQCGGNYCIALTQTGSVHSWGNNSQHQTGHERTNTISKPTKIKALDSAEILQVCTAPAAAAALHNAGNANTFASRVSSAKGLMEENVRLSV